MVPVKQLNEPGQKWAGRQMKPHHPLPSLRCLKLSIQFGIREGNTEKGNLDEGEGRGRGLCSHHRFSLHWDSFLCISIALTKRLSQQGGTGLLEVTVSVDKTVGLSGRGKGHLIFPRAPWMSSLEANTISIYVLFLTSPHKVTGPSHLYEGIEWMMLQQPIG